MSPALAGGFLSTGPPRNSYTFLLIFSIILRFSLCSSILLLTSVNIFMTDTLNSLSGKLLIFVSLRSFFWGFSLFFGLESIPLSPHFAYLCVFVCNRQNEEAVLCRCFTWLRSKISLSHQSQAFYGHPSHGLHVPTVFRATGWTGHRKFAWSSCGSAAVRGGLSLGPLSSAGHRSCLLATPSWVGHLCASRIEGRHQKIKPVSSVIIELGWLQKWHPSALSFPDKVSGNFCLSNSHFKPLHSRCFSDYCFWAGSQGKWVCRSTL